MIRGQVGIAHSHRYGRVSEDLLKSNDIATVHHEVTGEGVTQYVGCLAFGQRDRCAVESPSECTQ